MWAMKRILFKGNSIRNDLWLVGEHWFSYCGQGRHCFPSIIGNNKGKAQLKCSQFKEKVFTKTSYIHDIWFSARTGITIFHFIEKTEVQRDYEIGTNLQS